MESLSFPEHLTKLQTVIIESPDCSGQHVGLIRYPNSLNHKPPCLRPVALEPWSNPGNLNGFPPPGTQRLSARMTGENSNMVVELW